MSADFDGFLAASSNDRRDAFVGASQRLGTAAQNIEKDFWVCWTLDALFNRLPTGGPRLLFKGGTSLSKAFGLISRFSEDIDITVFREDIGETASVESLEALSGKKRQAKLDAIKDACQAYIGGAFMEQLATYFRDTLERTQIDQPPKVELDLDDASRQSLLLWYPSVLAETDGYIRPAIKIESGAKSALDPNSSQAIRPYVADDVLALDLTVSNIVTVDAERTFWDKIIILHGLRNWFDRRGALRGGGQRVSRHYYDVYQLLKSGTGKVALANPELGRDCVRHARMFFNSPHLGLTTADPGTFALTPTEPMIADLRRDYTAMSGMIFGEVPSFDAVLESIKEVETQLNEGSD
jgi:Nucleotidyl transferase AbiEii toxin, Type IV TA system